MSLTIEQEQRWTDAELDTLEGVEIKLVNPCPSKHGRSDKTWSDTWQRCECADRAMVVKPRPTRAQLAQEQAQDEADWKTHQRKHLAAMGIR